MHNTGKDPVCFAEFYDVNCAAQAMLQLQGITLKGYDRPIRVEYPFFFVFIFITYFL